VWDEDSEGGWSACKGVGATVIRSQFWPGQNLAYTLLVALIIRMDS
jgi:hypothetical protein